MEPRLYVLYETNMPVLKRLNAMTVTYNHANGIACFSQRYNGAQSP